MTTFRQLREEAGLTQEQLARKVNVQKAAVSRWETGKRRIPAEMAVKIERATKGLIPREILRPDLFGKQARSPTAAVERQEAAE